MKGSPVRVRASASLSRCHVSWLPLSGGTSRPFLSCPMGVASSESPTRAVLSWQQPPPENSADARCGGWLFVAELGGLHRVGEPATPQRNHYGKELLMSSPDMMPTVVLVHGGFVDGSGWQGVYEHLKKDGL